MTSELSERQMVFSRKIGVLIQVACEMGFDITLGESYTPNPEATGHNRNGVHGLKLAQDLNLFKDGEYLTETEEHKPLGEVWEAMGGTWGGRFRSPDGNHYSMMWKGRA